MKVETFANMVSAMLYEKRFGPYYCEPVIAGIEADGTPYITGMDLIGAMCEPLPCPAMCEQRRGRDGAELVL
jgi:20S proteasome alpha/beta subunit